MTAPPKRRWFRFSLRTMFVAVTVFGVWLGWQLKIVREREAIITASTKPQDAATFFVTVEDMESRPSQPSDRWAIRSRASLFQQTTAGRSVVSSNLCAQRRRPTAFGTSRVRFPGSDDPRIRQRDRESLDRVVEGFVVFASRRATAQHGRLLQDRPNREVAAMVKTYRPAKACVGQ